MRVHVRSEDKRDLFAMGVVRLAEGLGGKLIIYSRSGVTGARIAKYRPFVPVYVGTPSIKRARILNSMWDLRPFVVEAGSYAEGLEKLTRVLVSGGYVRKGDILVETYGLQKEKRHFVELVEI